MTLLTGTLLSPTGTPITGNLFLQLSSDANLLSGACGGPAVVAAVPGYIFPLTNGSVPGGSSVYGADCLSPSGLTYHLAATGPGGAVVVERDVSISGATVDIGTLPAVAPSRVVVDDLTMTLGGDVTGPSTSNTVTRLRGFSVSAAAPAPGQPLIYATTAWTPGGVLGVTYGGTGSTALTLGSIPFAGASGVFSQDNSRLFWDNTTHRLGIGTNAPASLLSVYGNIEIQTGSAGVLKFADGTTQNTAATAGGTIGGSGTATQAAFFSATSTLASDSAFIWDNATKRLGIGLILPTATLTVSANASTTLPAPLSGTLFHLGGADAGASTITFDAFGVGAAPTVIGRHAMGTGAAPSAIDAADRALFQLGGRGYGTTGFGAAGPYFNAYSHQAFTDAAQGAYIAMGTVLDGANTSTERVRIDHNGNVGIGTTVPATQLDISSAAPSFQMTDTTGAAKSLRLVVDANAANFYEAAGAAGDVLSLDLANKRVGIGTAVPATQLDISSTAPSFQMTDTTGAAKSLRVVTDANVANFYEAAGAAGDVLSLDLANKRVGIGTAAPSSPLTVNGTVEIKAASGGVLKFADGTTQNTAATAGGAVGGSAVAGQATFWSATSTVAGDTAFLWDNTNKRLGVGVTPAAKLDVAGAASTSVRSLNVLSSGSLASQLVARIGITGTTDGYTLAQDGSSNVVHALQGGNVGIGTGMTAPARQLDVALSGYGRMRVQDYGGQVHNVMAYGAVGDGATDDTSKINDALAAAQATTPPGILLFPGGHKFKTLGGHVIDPTKASGLKIIGGGTGTTEIKLEHATNDLFSMSCSTTAVVDFEIGGFLVTSAVLRTGGWVFNHTASNASWAVSLNRSYIHDITMLNQYNGILLSRYELTTMERLTWDQGSGSPGIYAYKIGQAASSPTYPAGSELTMIDVLMIPRGGIPDYGIYMEDTDAIYMNRCGFGGRLHSMVVGGSVRGCQNFFWNQVGVECAGNYQTITDAAMTAGSTTLTSASNPFVAGDVGKTITVTGALASGGTLYGTITVYNSPGSVTLSVANGSGAGITGKTAKWGAPAHGLFLTGGPTHVNNMITCSWFSSALFGDGINAVTSACAGWTINGCTFFNSGNWGIQALDCQMNVTGCYFTFNVAGSLFLKASALNIFLGHYGNNLILGDAGSSAWTTNANANRVGLACNTYFGVPPVYGIAPGQNFGNVTF